MFEGKISLRTHPNYRHVPAYAAHRVCGVLLALALLVPGALFAESRQGTVAEIKKDTELLREPKVGASSYGLLPAGTLLKITDDAEGAFLPVEVELERGTLEGWIPSNLLGLEEQDREKQAREVKKRPVQPQAAEVADRLSRRRRIPKDETLLFSRAPSFFYGLEAGPHLSMINASDGNSFSGFGIAAGASIGFFVMNDLPLRIEGLYNLLSGMDSKGNPGNFGFLDVGASLAYRLNAFEFYGKVSYGLGMSVSHLPGTLDSSFQSVTDLSSIWLGAGVGYRIPISHMLAFTARLHYSLSLLQSPFTFQTLGLVLLIDLQG